MNQYKFQVFILICEDIIEIYKENSFFINLNFVLNHLINSPHLTLDLYEHITMSDLKKIEKVCKKHLFSNQLYTFCDLEKELKDYLWV
jgi:hypothetical protein